VAPASADAGRSVPVPWTRDHAHRDGTTADEQDDPRHRDARAVALELPS
jgi:hypothetical protein